MKDKLGQEINLGDKVITSHTGHRRGRYAGVVCGIVASILPKTIRLHTHQLCFPTDVIVVNENTYDLIVEKLTGAK